MKPLNLDNSPCSPTSSNCVIWQGPDLPCIKLCKGDTVSDVIAKLATELCTIMDTLDVSNYDLSCFNLVACGPNDFQALIQFLIDQICSLQNQVTTVSDPATSPIVNTTKSAGADTPITVADCFVVNDITVMTVAEYAIAIGQRVCSIVDQISIINTQITDILIRVTALENTPVVPTPIPSISIDCTIGTLIPGVYTIDNIIDELINNNTNGYCTLLSTLGSPAQIGASLVPKCSFGTDITSDPDWTATPTTLAQSLTNVWIAICEIYAATNTPLTVDNTNSVTLDITSNVLTANINDTGWVNLQGFAFYQGGMASSLPQCRRIGNQIHFRGTVYVPLADGAGTSVQPLTATDTYRTISRGLAYIGSGGMITDAQGRILFNSNGGAALSVIPSSVLTGGTVLDNQYVHSVPFLTRQLAVEQKLGDGQFGTVLLTAYGKIELLTNGTLRITGLNTLQTNSSDNVSMIGTSLFTNITSSFIGRSRLIDWITKLGPKDGTMSTEATARISGLLTIGRLYIIVSYEVGDNFTNVGAVSNASGQSFIATGTTPTTWTNGSRLIQVTDSWLLNEAYANFVPGTGGSQLPLISDTVSTGINAAKATELGGFAFDLDGLTVFVDRCTTDTKEYIPC
jgi:hypothetical protein